MNLKKQNKNKNKTKQKTNKKTKQFYNSQILINIMFIIRGFTNILKVKICFLNLYWLTQREYWACHETPLQL